MAEAWTRLECEAIVADYFQMLRFECLGQPYNKAAHNRDLQKKLSGRSRGSIEYKHQNISAILLGEDHVYIRGYLPAWNYQELLRDVVNEWLNSQGDQILKLEETLIESAKDFSVGGNWAEHFVEVPEGLDRTEVRDKPHRFIPRIVNFAELEARNRKLGELGESFVMQLEKNRLLAEGRRDLADEVEWTSKEKGDGAGYDIRSFDVAREKELYIEVKTTNSGKYQPFLISSHEVEFSNQNADQYSLYRVFEFSRTPSLFKLPGSVSRHVHLTAQLFRANL